MPQTDLIQYQSSSVASLSTALLGLEVTLEAAARENLALAGDGFTDAEKTAMVAVEELKLVNGMDLAALLLRGKLIKYIEDNGLQTIHPDQYISMEHMAKMQGITPTEYSNIRDLYNTVFPYMQSLGFNIAQVWDEAGKSAFKEILPVVKALITGVMPGAQTAVDAVNRMLDDVAATNAVGGVEMTDEEMRETAFRSLLDLATTAPVRQVRDHIRPGHTPNLEPLVIRDHERRTIVIDVTEEQWTMYNRLNNGHMDIQEWSVPNDARTRQREALQNPVLRRIMQLSDGE